MLITFNTYVEKKNSIAPYVFIEQNGPAKIASQTDQYV